MVVTLTPLWAWNNKGHMVVATIAWRHMTVEARAKADTLLRLNPAYATLAAKLPRNLTEDERRMRLFAMLSTWADNIKGDSTYRDIGTKGGNTPPVGDANASRNIGYGDKLRHKYWHFIDLPFSPDGTELKPAPVPNAETQITAFRTALRDSDSDDVKSYDLVWLLHMVGDVHQPLHAVARFTKGQPDGDDGGNGVRLCADPCRENLHSLWDGLLGGSSYDPLHDIAPAVMLAGHLDDGEPAGAAVTDVHEWLTQSLKIAQDATYASPVRPDPAVGPSKTNRAYRQRALAVAEDQAVLAGYRLARLLNDALKP